MPSYQEKDPQMIETMADFLNSLPGTTDEEPSFPCPIMGKTPEFGTGPVRLPIKGESENQNPSEFSLSWNDEDDLGIRLQVSAILGLQGQELRVTAVGVRPELVNKRLSVALFGMRREPDQIKMIELSLNGPPIDDATCTGEASFGLVSRVRDRLGDEVALNVFRLD